MRRREEKTQKSNAQESLKGYQTLRGGKRRVKAVPEEEGARPWASKGNRKEGTDGKGALK